MRKYPFEFVANLLGWIEGKSDMRSVHLRLGWVLCALSLATLGCKSTDEPMGSGTGGTDNGDSGMGDGNGWVVEPNSICPGDPENQQGPCCYRNKPNSARFAEAPDGVVELEYRLNWQFTINHPDTLSTDLIKGLTKTRCEHEEQSLLFRFELPKENGKLVAGAGNLTIGQGRYNCDQTYSFYTDGAAPVFVGGDKEFPGSDDSGRWNPRTTPVQYDPAKSGRDAWTIAFEDRYTGKSYSPFMDNADPANLVFDWEIVTENIDIESFPDLTPETMDCGGHIDENTGEWFAENNAFTVFARLDDNALGDNGINALSNINFAQLVAFGFAPMGDPNTTDRCEPGTTDCPWLKLPDSLCPNNDDERALFACHMGYEGNPDGRVTNCTADAPTTVRDDSAPDEGQCCDPMGSADSGLPACNGYILVNEFVAASAEITDDNSPDIVQSCD